jgi:hypothetical protein
LQQEKFFQNMSEKIRLLKRLGCGFQFVSPSKPESVSIAQTPVRGLYKSNVLISAFLQSTFCYNFHEGKSPPSKLHACLICSCPFWQVGFHCPSFLSDFPSPFLSFWFRLVRVKVYLIFY